MHYKIGWIGLAADKSRTSYRRKYAVTAYMLQSCELSTLQSKHVCSKLSEAVAGSTDTPPIVMSVLRERAKRETQDSMYSEICTFLIDC
jgi:hypothetical protein